MMMMVMPGKTRQERSLTRKLGTKTQSKRSKGRNCQHTHVGAGQAHGARRWPRLTPGRPQQRLALTTYPVTPRAAA